jgi:hypothetical protein
MADKPARSIDPLGIIALANILVSHGPLGGEECSCEDIPMPPCPCQTDDDCSCEAIPMPPCPCQLESVKADMVDLVSNPVFRQAVKGLDVSKVKTIEDFLSIVDEIRSKIVDAKSPSPSAKKKK